jgi:large subunit ribosomal protein L21
MFAVIKTGGKQYKVAKDDIIKVEKLDSAAGDTVELTDVLMVGNEAAQTTGTPFIEGATVAAEVLEQARGKKVIIFKKKRRKDYRRTKGHRQHLTVLRITDILTDGKKPAKRAAAKKPAPKTAADAPKAADAEKPAAKKPAAKPAAKADDTPKAAETKKPAAKKPAAKKPAAKASAAKKPAAKKPAAKRAPAKKPAAPKTKE